MVLNFKRIRLEIRKGLILFFNLLFAFPFWIPIASLLILGCSRQKEKPSTLEILWENERAAGVFVPSSYVTGIPADSIRDLLHVYLSGMESRTAILGDYQPTGDGVIFRPLIPFTSGLTYEVNVADEVIGKIQIPHSDHKDFPELAGIYPSQDTLPENLLKFYIRFSSPMREGQALTYITMLKNGADTVHGTFLDLQPELWNKDYTMLTLWLDPGRIKRDLQPNQRLGVPLESSASYTLIVRSGWPDTRGAVIPNDFRKEFFVGRRDSISPNVKKWTLQVPKQNTTDPLVIILNESLDGVLLNDALQITNSDGTLLDGLIELKKDESVVEITPELPWQKGSYVLQIESRLEDLAGNNLNRPFDRDIANDTGRSGQNVYSLKFDIQ
jgi:hypothetical protein